MSILMEVFQEELDRLNRQKVVYENSMAALPKGYISKKNIRGNMSYYLQYREGGKVVSKYIPRDSLQELEDKIARRKQLENSLRRVAEDQKRLRKVLG